MVTANTSRMTLVGFSGLTFHLGAFETPSVAELWARLESSPTAAPGGGGLVFENIVGRRVIHRVTAWPRCAVVKSLSANRRPELASTSANTVSSSCVVHGSAKSLHLDGLNAGAVFQVVV